MKAADFRKLALALPEVLEGAHMGHADFRVGGKIFATLGYPDSKFGMVNVPPHEQDLLVRQHPTAFAPASGAWGRAGSTAVRLAVAPRVVVKHALESAWTRRAPKRLRKSDRPVMPGLLRFTGAAKRHPAIGPWLDAQPSELGSLARAWFARMRRCGGDVRELMHDGYATACVEDAPFAYIGVFKGHVNVGFFHGDALPDPAGLLQGVGRYMRHVKVKPGKALDESSLEALIDSAYRDILSRLTVAR